jgi:uncharacterized protein YjeT (DUF2065 family)
MTLLVVNQRRKANPSGHPPVLVGGAVRSGDLPDDIDPAAWLTALAARAKSDQNLRRIGLIVIVIAGLFVVLNIRSGEWLWTVVIAVVLVVLGLLRSISAQWELPRIAQLDTRIRAKYGIDPVPGEAPPTS